MEFYTQEKFNLIYADYIFENLDFSWVDKFWDMLCPNGVFIIQTDYHSAAELKLHMKRIPDSVFISEVIYLQDWGGRPKKGFPIKHDYIFIYSNGNDWYWDASEIQVPKQMTGASFNPSGRTTKTPHSVFYDLGNFSTVSKERIKSRDGKCVRWQKPEKLLRRLMTPFLMRGMSVLDPFAGTGTSGVIAKELDCHYVGIEYDEDVWGLMWNRLNGDNI